MKHQQDDNAFAYVIWERASIWLKEEGTEAPWRRALMFYAEDHVFDRGQMWERNVAWRDPKNIRVDPLYDEEGNDARRDEHLDAINARYEADTANLRRRSTDSISLAYAVESVLEKTPPQLDQFENLIRTLEAFDYMVQEPLTIPAHSVERVDWSPSNKELEGFYESNTDGLLQGTDLSQWRGNE